ncbi:MAG: type II toxin-antitoxin system prevent-host-death family antitoxin [Acidobacteriota bacterium]|nr:type II toxin-antitoxin system prevent-host-death family antitoxin [Acidobacteriota bacterium]
MDVSVTEAKKNLTQLIQAVELGERVTICRRGQPVVDLVRTTGKPKTPRQFGMLKGEIRTLDPKAFEPMSDEEVGAFLDGRY